MRWSLRRRSAEPAYVGVRDWIDRGIAVMRRPAGDDTAPRDAAIDGLEQALDRLPRSHPRRDLAAQVLIQLLMRRYVEDRADDDLRRADELLPDDLRQRTANAPTWTYPASMVSTAHHLRWADTGTPADLDESLRLFTPSVERGDDLRTLTWLSRASEKHTFYDEAAELDQALARAERVLDRSATLDDEQRALLRAAVGCALVDLATVGAAAHDGPELDRGVALLEEVVAGGGAAATPHLRASLSYAVRVRGSRDGRREDLDRSLALCEDASDPTGLAMLAYALQARHDQDLQRADLEAALEAARQALTVFDGIPADSSRNRFQHARARAWVAAATADVLASLYWTDGSSDHLDELLGIIATMPEPLSASARTQRAYVTADLEVDRWRITGDLDRLRTAIALLDDPRTVPSAWDRPWFARLHATALLDRAELAPGSTTDDIDRAEQLLDLATPRGDRVRWRAAVDADRGRAMLLRGRSSADAAEVQSAARLLSDVVAHEPAASPLRPRHLRALGAASEESFVLTSDRDHLVAAVEAYDTALAHPCAHTVTATDIVVRRDRCRSELCRDQDG